MSRYTTGEIAKLAGVTVRTVQYYDTRGILIPSEFSEGGRRLYSDEDLNRLRVICFLRDIGIPINSIAEILAAENAEKVISVLLEQQLSEVKAEIADREKQRDSIELIQREMKYYHNFSIENLTDIAEHMKSRKELNRTHLIMLIIGIGLEIIEWVTGIYGMMTGTWWPFLVGLAILVPGTAGMVLYYYNRTAYICPECHAVFRPKLSKVFWAYHTPTTRKLVCSECGYHGLCVETYRMKEERSDVPGDMQDEK